MISLWKDVEGFPNYEVSRMGDIRNKNTGRMLKQHDNRRRLLFVRLYKDGHPNTVAVHTLVARAFVEHAPEWNADRILHQDGDYTNCRAENLLWRNRFYFAKKEFENQRAHPLDDREVIDLSEGMVYKNALDAARKLCLLEELVLLSAEDPTHRTSYAGRVFAFYTRVSEGA